MNNFNNRQKEIIALISNARCPMTGKEISQILKTSMRTIQGEIMSINKKTKLITSSNKGYFITVNYRKIENELIQEEMNDEHFIIKNLIMTDDLHDMDEFSESIYISRTSLELKIKSCNHILENFHLTINKSKNHIQIIGSEENKRKCIKDLIVKETFPTFVNVHNLEKFYPNIDVSRIETIISTSIHNHGYTIDEPYRSVVMINTVIALHRMRSNHYVACNSDENEPYYLEKSSEAYHISKEICHIYAKHWSIHPMEEDICYIGSLLIGQMKPINKENQSNTKGTLSQEFTDKLKQILESSLYSYSLSIDISNYMYCFALHIDSMIKRIKATYPANNELLDNLKKNCPFIYDVSVRVAHKLEKEFSIQIPDSEIGYICLHIGFLIESSLDKSIKAQVVLYTSDYHRILSVIEDKINEKYKDIIDLKVVNSNQIKSLSTYKCDLIITTQPIQILGQQLLLISPFYTYEDQTAVDFAIKNCIANNEKTKQIDLFSKYFDKHLWFKNRNIMNKRDVIKLLGEKLIESGIVGNDFVQSVLERERLSSTCFYGNFAIPHALDMNAKKTSVGVLISDDGIPWDDKRIHIILMIAVKAEEHELFMELYTGIVRVLKNQKNVSLITSSNTYEDFIQALKDSTLQ